MKCRCGCNGEAVYLIKSYDFDPNAKDFKGQYFEEPACVDAAAYLTESAYDYRSLIPKVLVCSRCKKPVEKGFTAKISYGGIKEVQVYSCPHCDSWVHNVEWKEVEVIT